MAYFLIESAVCTNKNSSGSKRSWKAFLEYTVETNANDVVLTVTKVGLFGTTPAGGSGMEIRNRNITLKVGDKTLKKTFNGSSHYFNAYPNKTPNYKDHLPLVGSGGANNYDWTNECVFTLPRKASEYTITIDFNMNVTSGAWEGSRSVAQQVVTIPANENLYHVPTGYVYHEQTQDVEHIGIIAGINRQQETWVSPSVAELDTGDVFWVTVSNLVHVVGEETVSDSATLAFYKGTSEVKQASYYESSTRNWRMFTAFYDGVNTIKFLNFSYEEPINVNDLYAYGEIVDHAAGESVDEAKIFDVLESTQNHIKYTFDGTGWVVSIDDEYKDALTTVTLLDEINFEPVTSIAHAFTDCENLTTSNIPSQTTDITGAFENCTSLTGYITIPDTVTDYEDVFLGTVQPIFIEGAHAEEIASELPNTRQPKWAVTHTVNGAAPDILSNGKARISIYALNYQTENEELIPSPSGWDVVLGDNSWSVTVELGKDYVDDNTSVTATAEVRVAYSKITTTETEAQSAFYNTSRNLNYQTGLANNVCVSGCSVANYASRVWYSEANNPVNFPDDRFMEVGSNDKQIMGLVKVDEYLGVVKQGATTETSIYLAYPTSFDDDTAFAAKQSIGGVGALAKYAFNILNGETLFLSPQGIMAIETNEDDQHRVKDRGYFLNGKLLSEPNLEDAYSFVWNGWYLLAINDHIYVLDGNQRNSWGNDRTNLVYEGYYLEGVSANNFVSFKGELWFSTHTSICRFKGKDEENAYTDNGEPIHARWSTVLDDDGAINFYKTMRKKGNVISVLPKLGENTKVYVKKDSDDPVEIQREFSKWEGIPNEMFINKKFKKYKRLQFIIENDSDECFGVDSITKQYTIGNYAKK